MGAMDWLGWAQLSGYLAFALSMGSFLLRDQRAFLAAGVVSAFAWGWHFWLLGHPAAAGIEVLSAGRFLSALWAQRQSVRVRAGLTLAWCLVLALTLQASASWAQTALVAIASFIGIVAAFFLQGRTFRLALLGAEGFWLTFACVVGSVAGVLTSVCAGALNAYSIRRQSHETAPAA